MKFVSSPQPPLFAEIRRGAQSKFGELEVSHRHCRHGDLLGPDGVELDDDDDDGVEGGDEHEEEVAHYENL